MGAMAEDVYLKNIYVNCSVCDIINLYKFDY